MANRAVLGAFSGTQVLRVSRPGFNVLSTSLTSDQLAFDSRWTETLNEIMSGQINAYGTVSFGRTFPTPPLVVLRKRPWGSSLIWDTAGHTEYGETDIFIGDKLVVTRTNFTPNVDNNHWPMYYSVYENFYG